jgi:hypothetical protein
LQLVRIALADRDAVGVGSKAGEVAVEERLIPVLA